MPIDRREVLKSLGALSTTTALGAYKALAQGLPQKKEAAPERPNILVFLTDDHAQWLQQAYGNSEVHTPNMSRIAASGVRMTNAFTTCPVCSPARASFFTGRMPSQHGIHDWIEEQKQAFTFPWLKDQTLISELLKKAGYHTGLVGKWHCGGEPHPHPGFDFWFSYWVSQYPHEGAQNFSDNGMHITEDGFQAPMFTKQAMRFLDTHYNEAATASEPWFLFVSYTDTHSPHKQMPSDLVSQYDKAKFRDIPQEAFSKVHGTALTSVYPDASAELDRKKEYYAAASSVDREVGKILDDLEQRGVLANTLIVYTGDHGLNSGQHGIWEKGNATVPQNFLEESIRVPCSIAWPQGGIAKNLESDLSVNHCDLFATLLDAAHAEPSPEIAKSIHSPGTSYLPYLRGQGQTGWRDSVICEYGNARMIRRNGYKLILRYPFENVTFGNEFYDLRSDPRETVNLYSTSSAEYGPLIHKMAEELDSFFATYTVPGHSGLDLEHQPMATPASPWLKAVDLQRTPEQSPAGNHPG
jgi:arylsulfatase A-like enzyme